jgi:GNAT superfamily N-acetyltransferase
MPEIKVREATLADGPVLAEIERRSPIVVGGSALVIDRGDDYFAAARLMEDVVVLLAEVDGVPAGVLCQAYHRARLGGVERRMVYIHHNRVLPEYQRMGVGRALAPVCKRYEQLGYDSTYWYISKGNTTSQAFASAAPNRWTFGPELLEFDCQALAGPIIGRSATAADARRVAPMLNAFHGGEEMFLPYTAESLAARLSRDSRQYGWDNLRLTERAVVGVWPEGEWVQVRVTGPSGVETSRSGAVLDYGCLPGGEAELFGLIGAWCSWLLERGMMSLSMFTSPGSPLAAELRGPASDVSPFDFWTPGIPQPEGAESGGLYVDHVYF